MPQLIKNINGNLLSNTESEVILVKTISGEVQGEDYINMNGFSAYLQNLTKVEYTSGFLNPKIFGLKNKYNLPFITLNIDY